MGKVDPGMETEMTSMSLAEAGTQLKWLVEAARKGEEVVITEDELPVARLIPVAQERARLKRGSAKGIITYIAHDFDAPLDDFKEYMESAAYSIRRRSCADC